jgi:3-oxoacyl-[acyl-carrier protein] reductase
MQFAETRVAITGAGSGIGRETARLFAERGADVAIVDVDTDAAAETAAMLEADDVPGDAVTITADVTDPADVQAAVDATVEAFGGLDVLHNNAGILHEPTSIEDIDDATLERVIDVNLKGVLHGARAAVPRMRSQGSGVIVNTASTAGIRPRPGTSVYSASKGAVITLTKQLGRELAPDIRVNAVCPVATDTPLLSKLGENESLDESTLDQIVETIPLGRLVDPREVAQSVAFLASDEAAMITGTALEVDGGRDL